MVVIILNLDAHSSLNNCSCLIVCMEVESNIIYITQIARIRLADVGLRSCVGILLLTSVNASEKHRPIAGTWFARGRVYVLYFKVGDRSAVGWLWVGPFAVHPIGDNR